MIVIRWVLILVGGFILINVGLAAFERFAPPKIVHFFMKYLGNPMFRVSSGILPGYAVLEVIGRRTGHPHRVNVGGRIIGNTFWLLARSDAQYVRNLESNPHVRARIHGRWRTGVAEVADDDPRKMLLRLNPANGLFLWMVGADLRLVRIHFE